MPDSLPGATASGPTWQIAGTQFLMRIPDIARFLLNDGNVMAPELEASLDDIPIFILGTVFGILLHQREQIVLDASPIRVNGKQARGLPLRRRSMNTRLIRRLLLRFRQVDNRRRALLPEAVAYLLAARLALIFIPFPRRARHIGTFVPPTDPRATLPRAAAGPDQTQLAAEVSWAVTRAARYVPFKAVCLPQAMAARVMLKRRGVKSVMHFGAAKGTEKPLDAHARLDAAGIEVTGYPVAENFTEIVCFV